MLVIDFLTGTAPDLTVSAVEGMGAEVSQDSPQNSQKNLINNIASPWHGYNASSLSIC